MGGIGASRPDYGTQREAKKSIGCLCLQTLLNVMELQAELLDLLEEMKTTKRFMLLFWKIKLRPWFTMLIMYARKKLWLNVVDLKSHLVILIQKKRLCMNTVVNICSEITFILASM